MHPFLIFYMSLKEMKQCELADKIGMNRDTLYKKWIGKLRFSRYEKYKIRSVLECTYLPVEILFAEQEDAGEIMRHLVESSSVCKVRKDVLTPEIETLFSKVFKEAKP